MARLFITGDLHLTDNSRDAYRLAFMHNLPGLLRKHKADGLVILGDLTEEKDRHSAGLVNSIVKTIADCADVCRVLIKRGNHDYVDIESPFFRFLGQLDGITWVNTPTNGAGLPSPFRDVLGKALLLPHTTNYERDWDALDVKSFRRVLAHNTFAGAASDSGFKLRGIPVDVFNKAAEVVSGDIHTPQVIGPVTYVGAPYTIDFGDDFAPRAIIMDERGFQSLALAGPHKALVTIKSSENPAKAAGHVKKGDVVKVRVLLDDNDREAWRRAQDRVKDWAAKAGVTLYQIQPVTAERKVKAKAVAAAIDPKNDRDLVQAYAKARSVGADVLKTGLWLMKD